MSGRMHADTGQPIRVTFLVVMPTPYMQDLFDAIKADGRIRPRVLYLEMAAPDTHWGNVDLPAYATVLPGFWIPFLGARLHLNRGVLRAIAADPFDLVVAGGYMSVTGQLLMRWLHRHRVPWIFFGELPGMKRRRGLAAMLRWAAQRPVVRWSHGIAAIGSRAVESYRQMTAGRCPVSNIPYCCDMKPFLATAIKESGCGERVRFLYCGQLIHRKGVDLLIDAFCQAAGEFPSIELVLVGTGPLQATLEARIPPAFRARVRFAGFRPVAELPRFFADADVFVLPSRHDGWGVVVNQAIAAGLAVICTDAVGAADLVVEDRNGYVIAAGESEAIRRAICAFAADPARCGQFGQQSRRYAETWTPRHAVDRWYNLCCEVLSTEGVPCGDDSAASSQPE
jgi:glycosyltransferase involved in cell wall biosynthesis